MTTRIFSLIAALALAAPAAFAQVTVSKQIGEKSGFDTSAFAGASGAGAVFKQTLEADLFRSGWFVRAPAGVAEYALQGSAAGGLAVQCRVQERGGAAKYGKNFNVAEKDARRLAHQVADEIILALKNRKGMNSGRIAVIGNRTGRKELYVCDCDGQNMTQITSDNAACVGPFWGPGGRLVSYTSYVKGYPDAYVVDVISGSRRRVASFPGSNLAGGISPDGGSIALVLSRTGNPELYVGNISGQGLTQLTRTPKGEASPCWSPDGRQLAYVSDQSGSPQIYIVDRSGGAPRRLTSRGRQNVAPDWGANGWIVYASSQGGRFQLGIAHPASGESRMLANTNDGADYEDPTWAPDGRHILCARTAGYKSQLYLVDSIADQPSPPFPLTNAAGDWYSPAWSR